MPSRFFRIPRSLRSYTLPARPPAFSHLACIAAGFVTAGAQATALGLLKIPDSRASTCICRLRLLAPHQQRHQRHSVPGRVQPQRDGQRVRLDFNRYVGVQIEGQPTFQRHRASIGPLLPEPASAAASATSSSSPPKPAPSLRWPLGRFVSRLCTRWAAENALNGPANAAAALGLGCHRRRGHRLRAALLSMTALPCVPSRPTFQYSQVVYGPLVLPAGVSMAASAKIDALKLSGGLVARFGEKTRVATGDAGLHHGAFERVSPATPST